MDIQKKFNVNSPESKGKNLNCTMGLLLIFFINKNFKNKFVSTF